MPDSNIQEGAYNYAYLDEQTKRMIRRAILKAVAVPGYQVPFGGREMPLPYGWGTGVFQVPIPEPLRMLEPRETETRTLHALSEYGVMQVSLYESIARHGRIAKTYNYPVMVNGRYIMSPSPIPKFDNPKLDRSPALQLYGAGREKRIYAVPPHTPVKSLDFADHPFAIECWSERCAICDADDSFLDEIVTDDQGSRQYVCSDSD